MPPTPLYRPENMDSPAYHLRYTWTGWPSASSFPKEPSTPFFETLAQAWEADGIRFLEKRWLSHQIQLTCSVKPTVSPIRFTGCVKGRLEHALRKAGMPVAFSRKVAFRSVGRNKREHVETYVASQVTNAQFVDPRFAELIAKYTGVNTYVHLQEPTATNRGRYWYDLHLVLVTDQRQRNVDDASLKLFHDTCDMVARKKEYSIASRSVMPDHLHLALRGNVEDSPEKIALSFMNNIAFAFGQQGIFRPSYYVGTFGEYDMGAVRH